jgi:predicted  nucleic acid-binding Zn-ribbon protein
MTLNQRDHESLARQFAQLSSKVNGLERQLNGFSSRIQSLENRLVKLEQQAHSHPTIR